MQTPRGVARTQGRAKQSSSAIVNPELHRLIAELEPASPDNLEVRLRFGLACAARVKHLLETPEALACLEEFGDLVRAQDFGSDLAALATRADGLANRHQGSRSLDGVGHAAVSATYASAKAIAGKARQAAEYAAYAAVYGQGGYGATTDPSAYEPEQQWQAEHLRELLSRRRV